MCMLRDVYATEQFVREYTAQPTAVVWKVALITDDGQVYPPLYDDNPMIFGDIVSNREVDDDHDNKDTHRISIRRGIHVCLSKKACKAYIKADRWSKTRHRVDLGFARRTGKYIMLKCTAKIDDLVAIGGQNNDRAVFMKIHITKKEFDKGKKGRY